MRKTLRHPLQGPLLKRIQFEGFSKNRSTVDWVSEIGESLALLLNTHAGSVAARPDFGTPEFHPEEAQGDFRLQRKANELASLIERFEPRLKNIQVIPRKEENYTARIVFEVRGMLDEALSGERVAYQTVMTGQGRVWLRN